MDLAESPNTGYKWNGRKVIWENFGFIIEVKEYLWFEFWWKLEWRGFLRIFILGVVLLLQ